MTTDQILEISDKRLAELQTPFDPITGEGSMAKRFELKLKPESYPIYLPVSIEKEYGGLSSLFESVGEKDFLDEMIRLGEFRRKFDFEYWAGTCAHIQDKTSSSMIPFVLNRPQRKVWGVIDQELRETGMVRDRLLKSRQWGGSTLYEMIFGWVQTEVLLNWHSVIAASDKTQSRNIRGMYSRLIENYPPSLGGYQLTPYEGAQSARIIKGRGSIQSVAAYTTPDALRSFDIRMAHLCLAPETPVFTSHGKTVAIKNIKEGDEIITHNGHLARVSCITGGRPNELNGNGQSIKITPWKGEEVELTPNHPVFTQRGWVEAKNVTNSDMVSLPIRKIEEIGKIQVRQRTSLRTHGGGSIAPSGDIDCSIESGYFFGYYLAEGSVHFSSERNSVKEICLTRHVNEGCFSDRAYKAIAHLVGDPTTKTFDGINKAQVTFSGSNLAWMLHEDIGKKEEKLFLTIFSGAGEISLKAY